MEMVNSSLPSDTYEGDLLLSLRNLNRAPGTADNAEIEHQNRARGRAISFPMSLFLPCVPCPAEKLGGGISGQARTVLVVARDGFPAVASGRHGVVNVFSSVCVCVIRQWRPAFSLFASLKICDLTDSKVDQTSQMSWPLPLSLSSVSVSTWANAVHPSIKAWHYVLCARRPHI